MELDNPVLIVTIANLVITGVSAALTRSYALGQQIQHRDDAAVAASDEIRIIKNDIIDLKKEDEGIRKDFVLRFDREHEILRSYMTRTDDVITTIREKQAGLSSELRGIRSRYPNASPE